MSDIKLNGYWLCMCDDGSSPDNRGICGGINKCDPGDRAGQTGCIAAQAVIKPPAFQQLEIWFVRLIYVAWSFVGTLSFFFLIVLGYRYTISRGDVTKITEIRQKIIYYMIGLALVFLAVPILTTVFRVMGINKQVECYNVNMPGFQFFFTNLCTDPRGVTTDPCDLGDIAGDIQTALTNAPRKACAQRGDYKSCINAPAKLGGFCCENDQLWRWYLIVDANSACRP